MKFKLSSRIAGAIAMGVLAAAAIVPEALAATTSSTTNITGGTLSVTGPTLATVFPTATLNGTVQTLNATLSNWSVDDATGTGNGWNVTLQGSQLTEVAPTGGFATGSSALTLPLGSLALSGTRTITAGSGSTAVDSTGGPLLKNQTSAIDASSPVQIIDTQAGYGMGTYTITEPTTAGLTLTLDPSTTKVDTTNYPSAPTPYSTTLTFSVVSGP